MSDRDTFGPRLRAERERRGISLGTIAAVTNVSAELWDGLERNDFTRWPSGVFARSFVRDYARAIGLDAEELVNEFCRLFPVGDRRASRLIQAQAQFIGHQLSYSEHGGIPPTGDRRASAGQAGDEGWTRRCRYVPRALAAGTDTFCVLGLAGLTSLVLHPGFWGSAGVLSVLYFSASTLILGVTPGARLVQVLQGSAGSYKVLQGSRRPAAGIGV